MLFSYVLNLLDFIVKNCASFYMHKYIFLECVVEKQLSLSVSTTYHYLRFTCLLLVCTYITNHMGVSEGRLTSFYYQFTEGQRIKVYESIPTIRISGSNRLSTGTDRMK